VRFPGKSGALGVPQNRNDPRKRSEEAFERRLADEYDAAQERGEVASARDGKLGRSEPEHLKPTAQIGLSRKDIHEARIIRDAETIQPGNVRWAVDAALKPPGSA
jgi:hypothetical protein